MKQGMIKILESFCDKNAFRVWMRKPFYQEGYIYATNGYVLIRVKPQVVGQNYSSCPSALDCSRLFEGIEKSHASILSIDDFTKILENLPKVEEYIDETRQNICTECNGNKKVRWVYNSFSENFPCPVCHGEGYTTITQRTFTNRAIVLPKTEVEIFNHRFFYDKISILLPVIELTKANSIEVISSKLSSNAIIFRFPNDIDVIIVE